MSSSGGSRGGTGPTTAADALSLTLHGGDLVVRNAADNAEVARLSAAALLTLAGVTASGSVQAGSLSTSGTLAAGNTSVAGQLDVAGNVVLGDSDADRVGFYGKDPGVTQRAAITAPASTATSSSVGMFGFTTQAQGDAVVAAVRALIQALNTTQGIGVLAG